MRCLVGFVLDGIAALPLRSFAGGRVLGTNTSRGHDAAFGAEGRIDFSIPLLPHIGFVESARGATLPSIRGGSAPLAAGTVGLRLR